ncbi:aminopeptidase [Dyella soli]|uniref:Aminopeptidase n=2 Tax=Dyella soli TaxID=522319 RepID=A0A4R0YY88_9GAMM|nr:aminopeptidase [Dyella soli]TCI11420.1 aminopeptidase [Dyella soli]
MGLVLSACSTVGYYAHVAHGQGELVLHRRAVDSVIDDPRTDPALKRRLELSQQARRFASTRLALPENRSYTSYVPLDRPYVVWNVFATPRYAVEAIQHCFLFAGCVAYRGYFTHDKAKAEAARLQALGDDVYVSGVAAYSTLGWFADPILSSMLHWDDDELAGTIFHELAHQRLYVKDDSEFNESFAAFVQDEGVREWRLSRGLAPSEGHDKAMDDGFTKLVLDLRHRLKTLYASGIDEPHMATGKQREIADFRARYAAWREREWPGDHRYDAWVASPINNARLLPFGLYAHWTPAFAALFERSGRQWPVFYEDARQWSRLPPAERSKLLQQWLEAATPRAKAASEAADPAFP